MHLQQRINNLFSYVKKIIKNNNKDSFNHKREVSLMNFEMLISFNLLMLHISLTLAQETDQPETNYKLKNFGTDN
jgi:hypothetical protein